MTDMKEFSKFSRKRTAPLHKPWETDVPRDTIRGYLGVCELKIIDLEKYHSVVQQERGTKEKAQIKKNIELRCCNHFQSKLQKEPFFSVKYKGNLDNSSANWYRGCLFFFFTWNRCSDLLSHSGLIWLLRTNGRLFLVIRATALRGPRYHFVFFLCLFSPLSGAKTAEGANGEL